MVSINLKNIIYLFIFFAIWVSSSAQNADSLKIALKNSAQDTTKCDILSKLTAILPDGEWELYNNQLKKIADENLKKLSPNNPLFSIYQKFQAIAVLNTGTIYLNEGENDKALESQYEALKTFEKIKDKKDMAECLMNIGNICQKMGDVPKALDCNLKSLKLCEEIKYIYGITETLNSISIIYKDQGNIFKALEYQNRNLETLETTHDKQGIALSLNNLASIYNDVGDISKALEYLGKSLKIYEEIKEQHEIAYTLNNIGNLYYTRGDSSTALDYYNKSLDIWKKTGDQMGMARTLVSIGNIYQNKNNLSEALNYYAKSLKIREELALLPGIAQSLNLIGEIYAKQNQTSKALDFYQRSLKIYEKINDKKGMVVALNSMAKHYLNLNQQKEALFYSSKSLQISQELGYPRSILLSAEVLKDVYEKSKDYAKAFEMYKLFIQMRDSINNEKIQKASLKQQLNYEYEKKLDILKEKQEKTQELYLQKRKYYFIVGISSIIFFGVLFYLSYVRFKLGKEKEKQKMLIQVKDSEIKALQAQMNPHFIFNALNSILEFIRKSEKELAINYLTKFSRLVRMVLEYSGKKHISLKDELEMLNLYINLENLRFRDSFVFSLDVNKDIDIQDTEIPTLIIQPFIENAIIHGLQNKKKILQEHNQSFEGKLSLTLYKENNCLRCVIEDNGIGREKADEIKKGKLHYHNSIGMRVTKDRLDLLSESNCKIEYLDLKDSENNSIGTKVEILIPLLENY